jgi:xylulokinase
VIIAAYDLGTTGCKASLFDEGGPLIATAYCEFPTYFPKPGWAEQDPQDWIGALKKTTAELLQKSGIRPTNIACLSFSGHMMGCVPVDARGAPLARRAMLWADTRSRVEAARIQQCIGWEKFYAETGGGLDVSLYPAAKIPWIRDNQPDLYRQAAKFIGTKDTVCAWLTGKVATDFSDASDIGLLRLERRRWHQDFLEVLGIDPAKMPELLPSTAVLGSLKRQAAGQIGLAEGTPVVIGGGDVSCGTAGAGAVVEDVPYMCIGSAGWVSVAKSRPLIQPAARPMSICHVVPDLYCSQLIMYSAGVAYKWIRDEIFFRQAADGEAERDPEAFHKMDQLAALSPPGSAGVLFLPYLRSGGAPHFQMEARGAFLGLSLTTRKADLLRAVLEGVAYNVRLMVEPLEAGGAFASMRIIGGGAASALWRQIFADVLQKDVLTLSAQQEANTVGAALVGAIGVGICASFSEIERFSRIRETTSPNQGNIEVYQRTLPAFVRAFEGLRETHLLLSAIDGNGKGQGG